MRLAVRHRIPLALVASVCVAAMSLTAVDATAEPLPERDPYATVGAGFGLFFFLPSVRLFARYAWHDISFEVRAGMFVPSLFTDGFFWDAAAGPRFHVLQRESVVGFLSPRVGFWDIGPANEDEDANSISVTESDSRARKLLNPMASLVAGADFFVGSFVITTELGAGIVWGQRFNNMDTPVVPLAELNAHAGWVF